MALQIIFQYQNADSTAHLNQRLARLVGPGIYYGGTLSYSAGATTCSRSPVLAVGYDGATIVDNSAGTIGFTAAGTFHVVIRAKYNVGGSPSTPTISEEILTAVQYAADPDINYLIIEGTVTTGAGGVISSISYASRDVVDALGRDTVRGVASVIGDLPSPSPTTNRTGDCYFVIAEQSWYYWTGAAWAAALAAGSASRQTAYDDVGSGAGRTVTVNNQAILDVQATTSQRGKDIANAARRIDKSGSTVAGGDIGEDIKVRGDRDYGGILIRSRVSSGTAVQEDEPVTLVAGGNTITMTRPPVFTLALERMCQFVEITGTTNNQDGLYDFDWTGGGNGTIKNLDNTSPVLAADTGIANFYTIRFCVGSFLNRHLIANLSPGILSYAGAAPSSSYVDQIRLIDTTALHYVYQVIDIATDVAVKQDWVEIGGDYRSWQNRYYADNYLNDSGGFIYGQTIEKWIWPNWESAQVSDPFTGWRFGPTGTDPSTTECGIWECTNLGEDFFAMTSDWPEGMSLRGIEVDWNCSGGSPAQLEFYCGRQRWNTAGARTIYPLLNSYPKTPVATGRRKDIYTPTKNYGRAAPSGITDAWTHGGSVSTQTSDKLVLRFYSGLTTNQKFVYAVRILVRFTAVCKWDGPGAI